MYGAVGVKKGPNSHWLLKTNNHHSRHTGKSRCKNRSPLPKCPNREGQLAEKKKKKRKKKRRRERGSEKPTPWFLARGWPCGRQEEPFLKILTKRFENLQNAQSSGPWIDSMEEPQKKQGWTTPFTNPPIRAPPPLELAVDLGWIHRGWGIQ